MSTVIVLDPTVIVVHAQSESRRLMQVSSWTPAFDNAVPDAPVLVKRLDQVDLCYYIVPFMSGNRVTARLRMNAYTGAYAEGIGIGKTGDALEPYHSRGQAYRRLATSLAAAAKKHKKTSHALSAIAFETFPMWKPCAQSFSAFLPFYVVTVGTSVRYVRVDGRVFEALTGGAGI
jgi:hypothetical protein